MPRSGRDLNDEAGLGSPSLPQSRNEIEPDLTSRSGSGAANDHYRDQAADGRISARAREREQQRSLDASDVKTLTDIGTFRAIVFEDLARHRYRGDHDETKKHLASLIRKGLVRSRTSYPERVVYATLTRAGHRLVTARSERSNPSQKARRPSSSKAGEAGHDATCLLIFPTAIRAIELMGGRVRRVILTLN